jgi:ATP-binding cassette subfamily C protein
VSGGASIAASIIGARALQPIEGAIESWRSLVSAQEAFDRVKKLLASSSVAQERLELPNPKGEISVERLAYAPQGSNEPIVKGLTFTIPAGSSVALIGPTGAGKSTLAKLLVGALHSGVGAVRIDDFELKHWNARQLSELIGYLPQDVELFPGTIAENIGRMRADVPSEDILAAAEMAGVHGLIARFKQGYDTMIQLGGAPLSGGQRQRVALARAFFGKPKFVVLDEPDANLDREGEDALLKAMMAAKRAGITVVVTTQRATLLRYVDRIMMMRDGGIEAYGPRDQVLKRLMSGDKPQKDGEHALPATEKPGRMSAA